MDIKDNALNITGIEYESFPIFNFPLNFIYQEECKVCTLRDKTIPKYASKPCSFQLDLSESMKINQGIFPLKFEFRTTEQFTRGERLIFSLKQNNYPKLSCLLLFNNRISIQFSIGNSITCNEVIIPHEWNSIFILLHEKLSSICISINQTKWEIFPKTWTWTISDLLKSPFLLLCGGYAIGHKEEERNLFKGQIQNFSIFSIISSCDRIPDVEEFKIVIQYGRMLERKSIISPQLTKIYFDSFRSLEEISEFNKEDFKHMEQWLEIRERVPMKKSKGKLHKAMICHDIPSQLFEDMLIYGNRKESYGYRFEHWENIDYFIYFTHANLVIPPPGWIRVAHANGVRILGTFITEFEPGEELNIQFLDNKFTLHSGEQITKEEFHYANKLVEICEHFGFDGYLMNIEAKLEKSRIPKLLAWCQYLRVCLQMRVSGAKVVWYDSVTINGDLRWQSMLNQNNSKFMQVSDIFFSDYHWDISHLGISEETATTIKRDSFDVFMGIDVYGRGTWGGGKLDTILAVQEIMKHNLSIAIFGQAYYYQNEQGYINSEIFKNNESRFWDGMESTTIATQYGCIWDPQDEKEILNNWKCEGDWVLEDDSNMGITAVGSFNWCKRQLFIPLKKIMNYNSNCCLLFTVFVKGTPPKVEDEYRIFVEVKSEGGLCLNKFNEVNHQGVRVATGEWECINIRVNMSDLIKGIPHIIIITEYSKDIEYWAGNYGTRFAGELLQLDMGTSATSIGNKLKRRRIPGAQPFGTYFNSGMGSEIYFNGHQIPEIKSYNNIGEYDLFITNPSSPKILSTSHLQTLQTQNPKFPKIEQCGRGNIRTDRKYIYTGCSSLCISPKEQSGICIIQLFKTCFEWIEGQTEICVVLKGNIYIGENADRWIVLKYSDGVFETYLLQNPRVEVNTSWGIYRFGVEREKEIYDDQGVTITAIYFAIDNNSQDTYLGHFSIYNSYIGEGINIHQDNVFQVEGVNAVIKPNLKEVTRNDVNISDIDINWNMKIPLIQRHIYIYRVFMNRKWMGNSFSRCFGTREFISKKEERIIVQIQAVSYSNHFTSVDYLKEFIIT